MLAARPLVSFCAHVAPVFDEPRLRIGLFPEKEEVGVFQRVEELIVLGRKCSGMGLGG